MQNFQLTVLGSSSATPTSKRNPTAQLLNIAERFFLIDCGEATQIQLRRFKIKFSRINHICISHLHGDHYLGLIGFLSSLHLLGRTTDLNLYCPKELKEILDVQFRASETYLRYKIIYHFHNYVDNEVIFEDEKIEVRTIVLNHRIPCCGFIFKEKIIPGTITRAAILKHDIPVEKIAGIKKGADFVKESGEIIPNADLVRYKQLPRSYAYCSDTKYDERIIPIIKEATLLYHEATFMEKMLPRAQDTFHSTTIQAGTIALKANVSKLMIGHYSARYKDLEPLLEETKTVFENTMLAIEGECTIL